MGEVWSFGPIMVKEVWLVYFVTGIVVYIGVRWLMARQAVDKAILDPLWTAFFWFLIVWKVSYGLLHPLRTLDHPGSLLYFTGGTRGVFLALAAVVLYFYWTARKERTSIVPYFKWGLLIVIIASGVHHLLAILLHLSTNILYSLLQCLVAGLFVGIELFKRDHRPSIRQKILWYCLLELGLTYFTFQDPLFLGFSLTQWILMIISVLIITSLLFARNHAREDG